MNKNPNVMMIVPVENGFVFMPINMDLMMSLKDGSKAVQVAADATKLSDLVHAYYEEEKPSKDVNT